MMNINNIPGFEKTPDKIEAGRHGDKICRIAGLTVNCGYVISDQEQIKKLLDDRRVLLKLVIKQGSYLEKLCGNCYCDGCLKSECLIFDEIYEIKKTIKQVTGKTWEELQG